MNSKKKCAKNCRIFKMFWNRKPSWSKTPPQQTEATFNRPKKKYKI